MSNNIEYQERLAIEYISPKYCSECPHYYFNDTNQICLFNSEEINTCNLVQLDLVNGLNNERNTTQYQN